MICAGAGIVDEQRAGAGDLSFFLPDDVVAEVDAVGADVDVGGAFDHRADIAGGLAAERAGGDLAAAETAVTATPPAAAAIATPVTFGRNSLAAHATGSGRNDVAFG